MVYRCRNQFLPGEKVEIYASKLGAKVIKEVKWVITSVSEAAPLMNLRTNGEKLIKQSLLRILWSMDSAKSQNFKNYPSLRCLGD